MAEEGEFPKVDGDELYASEVNEFKNNIEEYSKSKVQIGAILKTIRLYNSDKEIGTNTSLEENKLIDTNADFSEVKVGDIVMIDNSYILYIGAEEYFSGGEISEWVLRKTFYFPYITQYYGMQTGTPKATFKFVFYYDDGTISELISSWSSGNQPSNFSLYGGSNLNKRLIKTEFYSMNQSTKYLTGQTITGYDFAYVENISSENQITLSRDLFVKTGTNYKVLSNTTPEVDSNYIVCRMQTINDSESLFDGINVSELKDCSNILYDGETISNIYLYDEQTKVYENAILIKIK